MIKKISALLLAAVITGAAVSIYAEHTENTNVSPDNIQIDAKSHVEFDFKNARVRFNGWNKDYVQINHSVPLSEEEYEKLFGKRYSIDAIGNRIKLNEFFQVNASLCRLTTWLPVIQFDKNADELSGNGSVGIYSGSSTLPYDFEINVPKGSPIAVTAKYFKAIDCSVAAANADEAVIRESTVIKGFVSEGGKITVRDCTIYKNHKFNNEVVELRDNQELN